MNYELKISLPILFCATISISSYPRWEFLKDQ